jgi:hypothetical protein
VSGRNAGDLADAAERATAGVGTRASELDYSLEPVDLALTGANESLTPWRLAAGVRLRFVRSLLLRMLRPFAERQHLLNAYLATSASLQADELALLKRRVEELEAARESCAAGDDRR